MANGFKRDLLELTHSGFRARYAGELNETDFSEIRAGVNPREAQYILYSDRVALPNSDATIWTDNTKVVTQIDVINYTPDTVAALNLGGVRRLYIPYGATYSLQTSEQMGVVGFDDGTEGNPYIQLTIYGYAPAGNV